MKSIKPGRGPSAMGAMGSVVAIIFGIFWTIMAASMGAPVFFPIFGVIFVLLGVVQAVYHFKNATGKERFSEFDIVDSQEEPDPLERRFSQEREPWEEPPHSEDKTEAAYCPYCGAKAEPGFVYCAKCGRKLP